jgi:5-methylcytosine-specific restriction endonuclease McrA
MDEETIEAVRARANERCEYCQLPEAFHPGPFEVEHVIPVQHGGSDALGNLAYACLRCNRHKGPNLAGIDRQTSRTRLVD